MFTNPNESASRNLDKHQGIQIRKMDHDRKLPQIHVNTTKHNCMHAYNVHLRVATMSSMVSVLRIAFKVYLEKMVPPRQMLGCGGWTYAALQTALLSYEVLVKPNSGFRLVFQRAISSDFFSLQPVLSAVWLL